MIFSVHLLQAGFGQAHFPAFGFGTVNVHLERRFELRASPAHLKGLHPAPNQHTCTLSKAIFFHTKS